MNATDESSKFRKQTTVRSDYTGLIDVPVSPVTNGTSYSNLQIKHSDSELINQTKQDQGHWVEIMCDKRKNWQFIKMVPPT